MNNLRDLVLVGGPDSKRVRVAQKVGAKRQGGATKVSRKVTQKQMWTDLLQAGILQDEMNGLPTADLFKHGSICLPINKSKLNPLPHLQPVLPGSCLLRNNEGEAGPPKSERDLQHSI